ncbi:hypothetical protein HPB47_021134 [Ixodes persulcatus]|uniref:Uncharacterized protein n=1 Tax=Ixodes persulcatus TaxID=34615 RepID=A0AC60QDE0_IXOPE|nr:hypothetical protein HPB47_021134 [Ixodes persulcatus]
MAVALELSSLQCALHDSRLDARRHALLVAALKSAYTHYLRVYRVQLLHRWVQVVCQSSRTATTQHSLSPETDWSQDEERHAAAGPSGVPVLQDCDHSCSLLQRPTGHKMKKGMQRQISYDDDLKCITGVVQASMRNKSYALEKPSAAAAAASSGKRWAQRQRLLADIRTPSIKEPPCQGPAITCFRDTQLDELFNRIFTLGAEYQSCNKEHVS